MMTQSLALRPVARLELRLSPALLLHAELLQCAGAALDARIQAELDRNPALTRVTRARGALGCLRCTGSCSCAARAEDRREDRAVTAPASDGYPSFEPADRPDGTAAVLADAAAELPARDRPLAAWILADLDPRGFLPGGAAGVAAALGVATERVRRIVAVLRAVGPPGLCAADVRECLLAQLPAAGAAPRLTSAIVADHLPALALGRYAAIAAALDADTDEVLAARDFVRARLRPWAALDGAGPPPPAAPPDVVVSYGDDGTPEIRLPGDALRVDPLWTRLARDTGALSREERRDVTDRVRRAEAFLAALDERAGTLRRVAAYVAMRQQTLLRQGPAARVPLTRAEVSAELGLHESTVSRAVAGKRVRLPDGRTVAFADLFGAGGSVLATLRAIVAAEQRPLSDTELAAELGDRGYPVARRTVAKYRGQLGIPACARR